MNQAMLSIATDYLGFEWQKMREDMRKAPEEIQSVLNTMAKKFERLEQEMRFGVYRILAKEAFIPDNPDG